MQLIRRLLVVGLLVAGLIVGGLLVAALPAPTNRLLLFRMVHSPPSRSPLRSLMM